MPATKTKEKEYRFFSVEGRSEGTFMKYRHEATGDIKEIPESQYNLEGRPSRRKFAV